MGRAFLALAIVSAAMSMYNWRGTPLSGAMAFHFVLTVAFAGLFFSQRDVIEQTVLSGALAVGALAADGVTVEDVLVWLLMMLAIVGTGWVLGNAVRAADTLSYGDPLTGADNRRSWELSLSQAIVHHRRHGQPLSVALIDIDHFKSINDTAGHDQGDAVLRSAVATWRGCIRSSDTLARLGGDEFALLLPGCDETHAREVAERLLADLRQAVDVSCSIGVATVSGDVVAEVEHVLGVADGQLYAAKKRGRGRVCGTLVVPRPGSTRPALAAVPTVA
jgi:diguanylate cyclase (GGDEF)-like protein